MNGTFRIARRVLFRIGRKRRPNDSRERTFLVDRLIVGDTNCHVLRRYWSLETHRSLLLVLALLPAFAVQAYAQDLNKFLSEARAAYRAKDYAKAITDYAAVIKASPDGSPQDAYYNLGYAYFFQLQYQDAANTFLAYLKKYPQAKDAAEVQLTLGRSLLQIEGKADEALVHLAEAAKSSEFLEEARFLAADAYLKKGDTEKAAKTLENAMSSNASGPSFLRTTLQLVDIYIGAGDYDKAIALLEKLENSPGYADVIVTVNNRFMQIGDKHLEAKEYAAALKAYSSVRPRKQVMAIQTKRLAMMKSLKEDFAKQLTAAEKAKQSAPRGLEEKNAVLEAMIENTDKLLGELSKLTDYDATLQYRIGRCYFNMERYWPATVAFEAISSENPDSPDAPTSLFGAIISQWKLGRYDAAISLCATYVSKYPTGKQIDQVTDLNASLLLQENKSAEVIALLEPFLKTHPDSPSKEKLVMLLANARFQGGKYDDAAKDYDMLVKFYAASPAQAEEFVYRRALCDFLRNNYKATVKAFDAYEKEYPNGEFKADIRYRRGIILLALKQYDKLISSMTTLLRDPAAAGYGGQIHTLLGDAYSGKGDNATAATEYTTALRMANHDENVIEYSLEQATTLLKGLRRYDDLQTLWKDFLKQNPGHPLELRGVSELSKLLVRADKKDEAKAMLAKYALRDIHNTRSEYVEMLLSQLAGLYAPPRTYKKDAPKPDIDPLLAQLTKQLEIPDSEKTVTYIARVNFAKAELARLMGDPVRNARFLNAIANSTKPEDLGPILLSIVGQFLLDDKQLDKAEALFTRLRDAFPDSAYSDAAPVGLGRIALAKKNYEKALEDFNFALNRAAGSSMLKQATYGKGLALEGLKKDDEAKKVFETIVTTREWRGMEKAGALYELGEIADRAGDKGAANGYFQRIYISHKSVPEFVAKAYIRSAEMLEDDGQHDAAIKTYREFLKDARYKDTPEYKIASKKVDQ